MLRSQHSVSAFHHNQRDSLVARPARRDHRAATEELDVGVRGLIARVTQRRSRAPTRQRRAGQAAAARPTIGLALGGGAARGFAHIGVLRTLLAHGIEPDVIVGTSIGAVVGGCYAAGQLDVIEEWARGLTVRGVLALSRHQPVRRAA